jgi:hypothetical protein
MTGWPLWLASFLVFRDGAAARAGRGASARGVRRRAAEANPSRRMRVMGCCREGGHRARGDTGATINRAAVRGSSRARGIFLCKKLFAASDHRISALPLSLFAGQQGGGGPPGPLRRKEGGHRQELRRGHQLPPVRTCARVRPRHLPSQGERELRGKTRHSGRAE